MNPGALKHRIKIESRSEVSTDTGFQTQWVTVCEVWAEKDSLTAREFFQAQAVNAENTEKYRTRYRKGLDTTMRIVDTEGIKYNITGILNPKGANTELILLCVVNSNEQ